MVFNDAQRLTYTLSADPLILHKQCRNQERLLQQVISWKNGTIRSLFFLFRCQHNHLYLWP